MRELQKASIVLTLGKELRYRGSWTGETHVQKAIYVMQELLGVPTGFEFVLYKHGPFSFDLRALLSSMEADRFIRWEPKHPYGPSMEAGESADQLLRQFPKKPEEYGRQIDFVARKLGPYRVTDLEKLATALYVTHEERRTARERASRICELKPHISVAEAQHAVAELDGLAEQAAPLIVVSS
jgi:hypothetical protein